MSQADPTMELIEALKRADPNEGGRILYGVPIFVEHEGWEVDGKLMVVPKGVKPPTGGTLRYSIDKALLEECVEAINQNYDHSGKPIKLFVGKSEKASGHSDPKVAQKENPDIVGFGRRAYMGTFGPMNRPAILTDAFYKRGFEHAAEEYPERSAEFTPLTKAITGVALLKTDPKLPMGMTAFAADQEIIYYAAGTMADDKEKKEPKEKPEEKPTEKPVDKPADDPETPKPAPTAADAVSPATPQPFQPHEVAFADRLMSHLEANHPAIKYLCGEHKKYMDTQAAMAAPSATSGNLPTQVEDPKKKKPEERTDMSETERLEIEQLKRDRAADLARIAKLEEDNAILYATEAISTLEGEGILFKDKDKEIKKLVGMKTLEERQERLTEIRQNYAHAERSPARRQSWLPIDPGHVEGGDDEVAEPEAAEILAYAEEHKIDASTDAGMKQIVKALTKKKSA